MRIRMPHWQDSHDMDYRRQLRDTSSSCIRESQVASHPTIAADKGPYRRSPSPRASETIKASWSWLAQKSSSQSPFPQGQDSEDALPRSVTSLPEICMAHIASIPAKGLVGKRDSALLLAAFSDWVARISESPLLERVTSTLTSGSGRVHERAPRAPTVQ